MSELISIADDGAGQSRVALEGCIEAGGVAVFPADTLYGLACDPLSAAAVARVHEMKGRSDGKPSAVLFFSVLAMRELLGGLEPRTREALAELLPGPVTAVVANRERRYPLACGSDPERLGVRLIEGPLAGVRTPVFQTSANRSGEAAAHRLCDVDSELIAAADLAIDGGELFGEPSTVLDLTGIESGDPWQVLREGALAATDIRRLLAGLTD